MLDILILKRYGKIGRVEFQSDLEEARQSVGAPRITAAEMEHANSDFDAADLNHDGYITADEMQGKF